MRAQFNIVESGNDTAYRSQKYHVIWLCLLSQGTIHTKRSFDVPA